MTTVQVEGLHEHVARLADGAHHVVGLLGLVARDVLDAVESVVERGTDEVGHSCIDDSELLGGSLLHVEHTGDERTALRHDGASELEVQLLTATKLQLAGIGGEVVVEVGNGQVVRMVVADSQTAAHVDVLQLDMLALELQLQVVDAVAECFEVAHIENLRADVEVQSDELDVLHLACYLDDVVHIAHSDAELVLGESRRDVGMRVGTYIGVDAQADASHLIFRGRQLVDYLEFGNALDVEAEDVGIEAEVDFPVTLAHAGIDYLRCGEAGAEGSTYLTSADAVGSQPRMADDGQHLRVGVCLHGVVDVEPLVASALVVDGGERLAEQGRVVVVERCLALGELFYGECSFDHVRRRVCRSGSVMHASCRFP